jgi:hypothetical protein
VVLMAERGTKLDADCVDALFTILGQDLRIRARQDDPIAGEESLAAAG